MYSDRRRSERTPVNTPAEIRDTNGAVIATCVVCNLSEGGAKLHFDNDDDLPREFSLVLPNRLLGRRCQIMWRIGNKVGVRFPTSAGPNAGPLKGSGVWAAE